VIRRRRTHTHSHRLSRPLSHRPEGHVPNLLRVPQTAGIVGRSPAHYGSGAYFRERLTALIPGVPPRIRTSSSPLQRVESPHTAPSVRARAKVSSRPIDGSLCSARPAAAIGSTLTRSLLYRRRCVPPTSVQASVGPRRRSPPPPDKRTGSPTERQFARGDGQRRVSLLPDVEWPFEAEASAA
jgi:hypothetical protein